MARYKVKVIPDSKTEEILDKDGILIVKIKEKPEKGKATIKLLKLLSDHFKKDVKLVKGAFSREKIIEVED